MERAFSPSPRIALETRVPLPGSGIKQGGTSPSALGTHYQPSSPAAATVLHLPIYVPFSSVTKLAGTQGSGRAAGCKDAKGGVCLPATWLSKTEEQWAYPATSHTQPFKIRTPLTSAMTVPLQAIEIEAR